MNFFILLLLVGFLTAQGPEVEKLVLSKNTVVPISSFYKVEDQRVYQRFLVTLTLGKEGSQSTPAQQGTFALNLHSAPFVASKHDSTVAPSGFNFTEDAGFTQTSVDTVTVQIGGAEAQTLQFQTWVRLSSKQPVTPKTPKTSVLLSENAAQWAGVQRGEHGFLGLGHKSTFLEGLFNTYKPEQGDSERIPISWSLSPKNEDHLFDSRAAFFTDTFVLNGFRSKQKRFGMREPISASDPRYYPNMNFRIGNYTAYNKLVCIDTGADTFVGLPSTDDHNKVWEVIQAAICAGKTVDTCDYSKAKISEMPVFEVDLDATNSLGQSAPVFNVNVRLNGSDVIKQDSEGKYLRKGLTLGSEVSGLCRPGTFVLGKWFFTKTELTLWVNSKDTTDVQLSLSSIVQQTQDQQDDQEQSSLRVLIFLGLAMVLIVVVVAIIVVVKNCRAKPTRNYQAATDNDQKTSNRTVDERA